jgi:diguanylate cyclase (GGDEF)-like protein
MTIKQKLNIVTVIFITTLVVLSLTVFFGYRHVIAEASLANDFDKESMYLQMMLRGLNEVIINEGTPSSLRTENEGVNGFDQIHTRLMAEVKDPETRSSLIKVINPLWQVIKEEIKPFQQHYVDLSEDEIMIEAGKVIVKAEIVIQHVKELSEKRRALVDDNSRLSATIEKTILLILVFMLAFSVYLARHISRSINKPIEELNSIAAGFSRGELSIMMNESKSDEFGMLAKHLNKSTKKLEHSTNELTTLTSRLQSEISIRKEAEKRISHMAYYDSLTGLPNRQLFTDRLSTCLKNIKRHKGYAAVLFFDIDDFKRINDTLGHSIGDSLLKEIATRVTECIRENDSVSREIICRTGDLSVSRLGGDEFIILISNIRAPQDSVIVAHRLMKTLSQPFQLKDHEIYVTMSIGIAISPDDGLDVNTIVRNADIAMYNAKSQGKNNYQFYTETMNDIIHKRLMIENNLRRALDNNELELYYQPRIDGKTGTISSMEALIRWNRPGKGLVSPAEFIPVAEDTGLIIPIGEWVLETACSQNLAWQELGLPPMTVSVNISGKQFQRDDFMATILRALEYSSLDPKYLELEVTENILMKNVNINIDMMKELSEIGIRISIDDFGTGYSSFNYLKHFPVDILKIDKSFIDDITNTDNDLAIVSAIISMAHSLNLKVVAEGVEEREQLDLLLDNKCDEIQGYYYSRPLPTDEFTDFVKKSMNQTLSTVDNN